MEHNKENAQTEQVETTSKVIDLTDGTDNKATLKGNAPKTPPTMKTPNINFDVFIPRVKALKGTLEMLSDEEIVSLALNKLTCDSYKSLKGVENAPAIACWLHLYNSVENGNVKLGKAICNIKKTFPGAMKYMLNQVKKIGSGGFDGFDHSELFELVEKYYFTKDKPKKDAKKEVSKPVKSDSAKQKAPVTVKTNAQKTEKKDEPLQLSLLGM